MIIRIVWIINNPGTRHIDHRSPSGSLFNVQVTCGMTVSLNGRSLTYNGSKSSVIIDNVNMQVIGDDFSTLSGNIDTFLTLYPGNNSIFGSGVVTFRPMYY